jgi:hypothetical protein
MLAGSTLLLVAVPASAQHTPVVLSDRAADARHADAAGPARSAADATAAAEPAPAAGAGGAQQPPSGPQRPMFQDIRYDEDWSVLGANPSLKGDLWDPVKYIPISGDSYWSIGGEIRHRFDYWHDANFGYINSRNLDTLLQRYMFHADLHVNRNIRAFGQFASALAGGRKGGPWPTDRNEAEVHQAFLEFMGGSPQTARWSLRFGRQEMAFGQSHFISTSDFYNTRRTFDGVRAQAFKGSLEFNAFVVRPVQINVGKFNDDSDPNQIFFATSVFANNPFTRGRVSLFYIGLTTHQWAWNRGFGRDVRHTIGMRMMGMQDRWDYVYEVLIQRGKFADRIPISAWGVTTDTGYTIPTHRWYPRIGVRVNMTSGDRGTGKLGTFNPMFPDVAYSGRIGLIGPTNSIDVTPNLRLALTQRIYFIPDFAFFWRQKNTDGIYGVVSPYVVLPGNGSTKRFIGGQLSLPMQINLTPHLTYTVAYGHLFAGGFLKDLQPAGRSVQFLTNFLTYKF